MNSRTLKLFALEEQLLEFSEVALYKDHGKLMNKLR